MAAAARIDFARGFFESGGFETIVSSDSFSACSASLACICGTDEAYAQGAEAAARELAQSGAKRVYLAGRSGDEAALRAAGVSEFIYMGVDVVAALQGAQAVSV